MKVCVTGLVLSRPSSDDWSTKSGWGPLSCEQQQDALWTTTAPNCPLINVAKQHQPEGEGRQPSLTVGARVSLSVQGPYTWCVQGAYNVIGSLVCAVHVLMTHLEASGVLNRGQPGGPCREVGPKDNIHGNIIDRPKTSQSGDMSSLGRWPCNKEFHCRLLSDPCLCPCRSLSLTWQMGRAKIQQVTTQCFWLSTHPLIL